MSGLTTSKLILRTINAIVIGKEWRATLLMINTSLDASVTQGFCNFVFRKGICSGFLNDTNGAQETQKTTCEYLK
jgi:hypothetical protein